MKNSYAVAEAIQLGRAQSSILGIKFEDPFSIDIYLGFGWRWVVVVIDIDESDE